MSTKKIVYDNLIMSWSCFGDFILVANTMNSLIQEGVIKKGIIITHEKGLRNLIESKDIILLYPQTSIKDACVLLSYIFKRNIYVLHDMPSFNKWAKEIRTILSILLTRSYKSKLLLLRDDDFTPDRVTQVAAFFANSITLFTKTKKVHITQYLLNILADTGTTKKVQAQYSLQLKKKPFDTDALGKYVVIHPFGSSEGKGPSKDWWISWISEFKKTHHHTIVLIGGKKDSDSAEYIIQELPYVVSLCGVPFGETFTLVEKASLCIHIDSGPSHYSAALGVPQICIWGDERTVTYMPTFNSKALFVVNENIYTSKEVYTKISTIQKNNYSKEALLSAAKRILF